jgi:hypothetical protein
MASVEDGRVTLARPPSDGELLPMTKLLDELLASDEGEEPPMRDASGNLVEVRVQVPWQLHQLSADGSNAAGEDPEAIKAPAEPVLVRLTLTCVEMLLEHHARFVVETENGSYNGALPGPFLTALMQFCPSRIPVVRAVNTAPLVTMSGQVIAGVGLDRKTGLFHLRFYAHACRQIHRPKTMSVLRYAIC